MKIDLLTVVGYIAAFLAAGLVIFLLTFGSHSANAQSCCAPKRKYTKCYPLCQYEAPRPRNQTE